MMGFDYAAKIRALIATAESMENNGNEEGASAFRAKALDWMRRYQIAEEAALAEDPTAAEPTFIKIAFNPHTPTMASFYLGLVMRLADHTEVRWHLDRTVDWGYEV